MPVFEATVCVAREESWTVEADTEAEARELMRRWDPEIHREDTRVVVDWTVLAIRTIDA